MSSILLCPTKADKLHSNVQLILLSAISWDLTAVVCPRIGVTELLWYCPSIRFLHFIWLMILFALLLVTPNASPYQHSKIPKFHTCICRSQNRSCTDLEPHFNGYKTAPLPLLNRTNVYARTFRATLPVFESHSHGARATPCR